jgi:Tfp pilus assembly protein FimT
MRISKTARNKESCAAGFSLIEILITVSIIMVIIAVAMPLTSIIRKVELREAGTDYAGLLQNARLQAIQSDAYYAVVIQAGSPSQAFIDLNGSGTYAAGDPVIAFPSTVVQRTYGDSPPNLGNLESQALSSATDLSLDVADNPTFGPRGLPCKPITAGGYTTCPAFSGAVAGTSFITFFQTTTNDGTWEAVVANPAGRIRTYSYSPGLNWVPTQ